MVMFLAKILIATMSQAASSTRADDSETDGVNDKFASVEDIDAARHKEIMWKAVSGILMITFKHLKSERESYTIFNHMLKF